MAQDEQVRLNIYVLKKYLSSALNLAEWIHNRARLIDRASQFQSFYEHTRRLEKLIQSAAEFADRSYLQTPLEMQQLPLKKLIDHVKTLCDFQAREKGLEIIVDLQPKTEMINIEASVSHLMHAFFLLFQNAIKYSYRTTPRSDQRFISVSGNTHEDGYEISRSPQKLIQGRIRVLRGYTIVVSNNAPKHITTTNWTLI